MYVIFIIYNVSVILQASSMFAMMARSVTSLAGRGGNSRIQHDDKIISLKGKPQGASQETREDPLEEDAIGAAPRPSSKPSVGQPAHPFAIPLKISNFVGLDLV